ncbi:MAG: penicillin-binding protein activator, partial [Sideroxydans sp.]
MQKVASESKWLRGFLVAALYVSVYGCATPPPVTAPSAVSAAPGVTQPALPVPVTPVATTSAVAEPAVIVPIAPVATPVIPAIPVANVEPSAPHIALILPLKSAAFAKSATALQQGFLAAAGLEANGLPVRVYPCNDEKAEVTAVYAQAIKAGAVAVAGPLTRNGVAALAANPDLDVPTLALNQMDMARTDQLYFFGLPVEVEARQMAQWAAKAGLLSATIVRTDTALSKRLAQAFTDSWLKSGGVVIAEKIYAGDATSLRLIPTDAGNMVFLA